MSGQKKRHVNIQIFGESWKNVSSQSEGRKTNGNIRGWLTNGGSTGIIGKGSTPKSAIWSECWCVRVLASYTHWFLCRPGRFLPTLFKSSPLMTTSTLPYSN